MTCRLLSPLASRVGHFLEVGSCCCALAQFSPGTSRQLLECHAIIANTNRCRIIDARVNSILSDETTADGYSCISWGRYSYNCTAVGGRALSKKVGFILVSPAAGERGFDSWTPCQLIGTFYPGEVDHQFGYYCTGISS